MVEDLPSIKYVRPAQFGFGWLPGRQGPLWRLQEDYQFSVAMPDGSLRTFWIPGGYEFDKASVPSWFWGQPFLLTPEGPWTLPSLEHDFLCDLLKGGSDFLRDNLLDQLPEAPPASVIHGHFAARLWDHVSYEEGEDGMRARQAFLMGQAVMAFGPQGWAWLWIQLAIALVLLRIAFHYLHPYLP
ncbi:hypothetical protein GCM10023213_14180 [Prosthecobacter algae]|uniref:Uncharacterized protein n=2 Tax=Prosthecobacter algae TaxID=1144682 RepID=A0ABP9P0X2_9BACT